MDILTKFQNNSFFNFDFSRVQNYAQLTFENYLGNSPDSRLDDGISNSITNLNENCALLEQQMLTYGPQSTLKTQLNAIRTEVNQIKNFSKLKSVEKKFFSIRDQEEQKSLETLKKFIQSPSIPIDSRILLHLFDEPSSRHSALEGADTTIVLKYHLEYFKQRLSSLPSKPEEKPPLPYDNFFVSGLEKMGLYHEANHFRPIIEPHGLEEAKMIRQIETALELYQALVKKEMTDIYEFKNLLGSHLQNLRPGESVVLPISISNKNWSHVIYFEFTKQTNGPFTMRFYNAGLGVNHHEGTVIGYQNKYLPFEEMVDIPIENILHIPLLQAIRNLLSVPPYNIRGHNDQDLYYTILLAVKGYGSRRVYFLEDLKTVQQAGTCSFGSFFAYMTEAAGSDSNYLRFKFETKIKALHDFAALYSEEHLKKNERDRRLFEKSLQHFSQELSQFHEEGVINHSEFLFATDLMGEALQRVKTAEKKYLLDVQKDKKLLDLKNLSNFDKVLLPDVEKPSLNFDFVPQVHLMEQFDVLHLENAEIYDNYEVALACFESMMTNLSLNDEQWGRLEEFEAQKMIHQIAQASRIAFRSLFQNVRQNPAKTEKLTPKTYLAFAKAVTLMHQIATLHNESWKLPLSHFYDAALLKIFNKKEERYFLTHDPNKDQEFLEIQRYWEKADKNENDFFQMGTHPPILIPSVFYEFRGYTVEAEQISDLEPELKWVAEQLENVEIYQKLKLHFPEIEKADKVTQVIYAQADKIVEGQKEFQGSRDILPSYFYDFRDILFQIKYLMNGQITAFDRPADVEVHCFDTFADWKIRPVITGSWSTHDYSKEDEERFVNFVSPIQDPILNEIIAKRTPSFSLIDRQAPNKITTMGKNDFDKRFSLSEIRQLKSLESVPKLQLYETLSFFSKQPFLLEKRDFRILFNSLMFAPGILLEELQSKDADHLINALSEFIKKRYHYCLFTKNIELASFYLKLNRQFLEYAQFVYPDLQEPFLDTCKEIRSLMETHPSQALLDLQLALNYRSKVPENQQEWSEFIYSAITYFSKNIPLEFQEPESEEDLKHLLLKMSSKFSQLSSEGQNQILNKVAKQLNPQEAERYQDQKWQGLTHSYRSEDGSSYIDFSKGEYYFKFKPIEVRLPSKIAAHPLFEKLFNLQKATRNGFDSYLFTGKDGKEYRIIDKYNGVVFQKIFERQPGWYQYVSKDVLYDVFIACKPLLFEHTHWYSEAHDEIFIIPEDGCKPKYLVHLDLLDHSQIRAIFKLDDQGHRTHFLIFDKIYGGLEDPNFTLIWRDFNGTDFIEFPRFQKLNSNFYLKKDKDVTESAAFPGFYLAKDQWVDSLKDFPFYLLLTNKEKENKVLIPFVDLKNSKEPFLTNSLFPINSHELNPETFSEYRIDPKSKHLIPVTKAARYHLAMIKLKKMEYKEAMQLLRGYESLTQPLGVDEIKALEWLIDFHNSKRDEDPPALAVQLYACYLLLKHSEYFDSQPNRQEIVEKVKGILPTMYEAYIEHVDKAGVVALKPEEELELLRYIPQKNLQLCHRLKDLSQTAEECQDNFPTSFYSVIRYWKPYQFESLNEKGFLAHYKLWSLQTSQFSSVIRPCLLQYLPDYYQMCKGTLNDNQFRQYYERLTGIKTQSESIAELKNDLAFILDMARTNRELDVNEMAAATLLRAVLDSPNHFPDKMIEAEELPKRIKESFVEDFKTRYITPALEHFHKDHVFDLSWGSHPPRNRPKRIIKSKELKSEDSSFAHCLAPDYALYFDYKDDLNQLISWKEVPKEDDSLISHLSLKAEDPHLTHELNATAESVRLYHSQKKPKAYINDQEAFEQLRIHWKNQAEEMKRELTELEQVLLNRCNDCHLSQSVSAEQFHQELGRKKIPVTIDQLILLFLQQDATLYHQANFHLNQTEISAISQLTKQYLVKSVHLQHVQNIIKQSESPHHLNELVQVANNHQAYSMDEHPEYLVFEYYMGFRLRPQQVENLNLLEKTEGLGVVIEMLLGAGKTSVIMPLLANSLADGEKLILGVIPESLMASMSQELSMILGSSFNQSTQVLTFNRDTPVTTDKLTSILNQFHQIRQNKQFLMMSSSSIQSLYLKFIETLHKAAEDQRMGIIAYEKQLSLFQEIFDLLKDQGIVILDEADFILNAKKEHLFALGSPSLIKDSYVDLVTALYDSPSFDKETLIQTILSKNLGSAFPVVAQFSEREMGLIKKYLNDEKEGYHAVKNFDPELRNLLALAKEEINVLLPLTLFKHCDKHYGLSKLGKKNFAIPYHGSNNPVENAQFGNPFEILNYTIQLYLRKGIPVEFVKKEVDVLRKNFHVELFNFLSNHDPHFDLFDSKLDLEKLTAKINQSTSVKLFFLKKYIIPEINYYLHTLNANPQIFKFLFRQVLGFTGTPWNTLTFPEGISTIVSHETNGKILSLVWKKCQNSLRVIKNFDPKFFANYSSAIDAGGFARGIDNLEMAKLILNHQISSMQEITTLQDLQKKAKQRINGVIFYDQQERLMILEKGKKDPIPLSQSTLPLEERFVYFDQKHSRGSNILQFDDAEGSVTISKDQILSDFLQAIGRMRGFENGQDIDLLMDEEAVETMKEQLKKYLNIQVDESVRLEHAILFLTLNQALLQADYSHRSLKQKIEAILIENQFNSFLEAESGELVDLFKNTINLFIKQNNKEPWDLFGHPSYEIDQTEYLNLLVQRNLGYKEAVQEVSSKHLPHLPKKILINTNQYGQEMEVENELNIQAEVIEAPRFITPISFECSPEQLYQPDFFKTMPLNDALTIMSKLSFISKKVDSPYCGTMIDWNHMNFPRFLSVNEVISKDVFDSSLIATHNYFPFYSNFFESRKDSFVPYEIQQKAVDSLLITENQDGELKMVLLDQNDAYAFMNVLEKDVENIARDKHVCLYKIGVGPYRTGKEGFSIKRTPQFLKLLVQAKFLDGHLEYSKEELPVLEDWVGKNRETLQPLFDQILKWKSINKREFATSVLGRLLQPNCR